MPSKPPAIIEIRDLTTRLPGTTTRYGAAQLAIDRGEIIALEAETPADGRHLLRILATLTLPESGRYWFSGHRVALEDYRRCLAIKRRIGYVAVDAAMISNRTVRENLLLSRFYYEDDLAIDLDGTMAALCADAGLSTKLHGRPSELSDSELLKAITIRELGKSPAVMLVDRPENFMDTSAEGGLFNHLKNMVQSGTALVLLTQSRHVAAIAHRRLNLSAGQLLRKATP